MTTAAVSGSLSCCAAEVTHSCAEQLKTGKWKKRHLFPTSATALNSLSLLQAGQRLSGRRHAEQRPATAEEERSEGWTSVSLTRSQREEEQKEKAKGKGIGRFRTAEREGIVVEQQGRCPASMSESGQESRRVGGAGVFFRRNWSLGRKFCCWGSHEPDLCRNNLVIVVADSKAVTSHCSWIAVLIRFLLSSLPGGS